uniref:Ferritin n=1 Tax=Panagrolaimus sp. JU765 TaxID=591449 RepID=A0AC34QNP4_9BILA
MSLIRQNYHQNTENAVNDAVNKVLNASYQYMELGYHFDRDDIALPNMHKYFLKLSNSKQEQADKLLKYQNTRGGRCVLQTVSKPPTSNSDVGIVNAFQTAINIEKQLNTLFLGLHEVAHETNDPQFSDFVEEDLLESEVEIMKELADHLARAQKSGSGLGEFLFDKEFDS